MASNKLPDYYAVLKISQNATAEQIRFAYKKLALLNHPDKNQNDPKAQLKFQFINDAYSILSDDKKRKVYDQQRQYVPLYNPMEEEDGGKGGQCDADEVFGNAFEDLLRDEMGNGQYFWQPIGAVSGAAIGFIVANIPGSIAGNWFNIILGFALGRWMGQVRDKKGKALMNVFHDLPRNQRVAILAALGKKVLQHMTS